MDFKDDKKLKILEAGIKVLSEQGVSNSSMNDIIRESGVSKGGVYHYFSSKNDLLVALCQFFFERYALSSIEQLQTNPEIQKLSSDQKIISLIEQHETTLDEMGKDISLMMDLYVEGIRNPELNELLNQQYQLVFGVINSLISEAQSQGAFTNELSSEMLSATLLAVFDGFSLSSRILKDDTDYLRMALDAARFVLKSAKTP